MIEKSEVVCRHLWRGRGGGAAISLSLNTPCGRRLFRYRSIRLAGGGYFAIAQYALRAAAISLSLNTPPRCAYFCEIRRTGRAIVWGQYARLLTVDTCPHVMGLKNLPQWRDWTVPNFPQMPYRLDAFLDSSSIDIGCGRCEMPRVGFPRA